MMPEQTTLFTQETTPAKPKSAFDDLGFRGSIEAMLAEVRALYLADMIPWIIGYSGGKDSTACVQLVWHALRGLPPEQRTKPVHVISTDTLVENPIVAAWAGDSLEAMRKAAAEEALPIHVHRLTPKVEDSFWTLLIGKGYPAPRNLFRWCTDRLKIRPSNTFITNVISAHNECILILGTRKAESADRARRMEALEARRVRDRLSPNASLPGSLVYSPIEAWSNDDVWLYLMQVQNPWGWSNKTLLTLYQGATEGGECPLVVDTSTPSCGASRFGCWTCTLVEQDKSMTAMIYNDADKEWMLPLLEIRNALDFRDRPDGDRDVRDFRRMHGKVMLMTSGGETRPIPGPYLQSARADWLRRVLEAQTWIRRNGPDHARNITLITLPELEAIRVLWVIDKHEIEDLLPGIYAKATGERYPGIPLDAGPFGPEDLALLREVAGGDDNLYETARDCLATTYHHSKMTRRAGLFAALEKALTRHMFANEEEALEALRPGFEEKLAREGQRPLPLAAPANPGLPEDRAVRAGDAVELFAARGQGASAEIARETGKALATRRTRATKGAS